MYMEACMLSVWSYGHLFYLLLSIAGALKMNRALQELHLTNNLLNSYQDALQLGDLLRYNTTLQTLEISNNAVADAGKMLIFVAKQIFLKLCRANICDK